MLLTEGKLTYEFPEGWQVTKYDEWPFYKNHVRDACTGNKAVDFLGLDPSKTLWMIEIKDYRQFPRTKESRIPLCDEIAVKIRDTLAGLFAAKVVSTHENHQFAQVASDAVKLRIVLHLEQPTSHSKLFRRDYDPADVQQKLKQMVKPFDAHPRVVELDNMDKVPWSTTST